MTEWPIEISVQTKDFHALFQDLFLVVTQLHRHILNLGLNSLFRRISLAIFHPERDSETLLDHLNFLRIVKMEVLADDLAEFIALTIGRSYLICASQILVAISFDLEQVVEAVFES